MQRLYKNYVPSLLRFCTQKGVQVLGVHGVGLWV